MCTCVRPTHDVEFLSAGAARLGGLAGQFLCSGSLEISQSTCTGQRKRRQIRGPRFDANKRTMRSSALVGSDPCTCMDKALMRIGLQGVLLCCSTSQILERVW